MSFCFHLQSKQLRVSICLSQPPSTSPLRAIANNQPPEDIEVDSQLPQDIKEGSPVAKDSPFDEDIENDSPLPKDTGEVSLLPVDLEDGNKQPSGVEQPVMDEESPPLADHPRSEAPLDDRGDVCEETNMDAESYSVGAVGSTQTPVKEVPSVDERMDDAASPVVEDTCVPLSRISSPDLLTPYMLNSPFRSAASRGSDGGRAEERCRRGTFLVSAAEEVDARHQVDGTEGSQSTEVAHTEQKDDQCNHRDDQAQKVHSVYM